MKQERGRNQSHDIKAAFQTRPLHAAQPSQAAPQHRHHLLALAPAHAALPTGVITGTTHDVRGARSDNDVTILQDVSFGIHSSQPFAAPAHACARSSPLPQPHLKATAELAGHCNVSCMRTSRGILRDDCAALASCVPVFKLCSYNIFIIYMYIFEFEGKIVRNHAACRKRVCWGCCCCWGIRS